jgi:hypothetical protein
MAGCKSCSGRSHKIEAKAVKPAEKLGCCELSSNPRYPRVFVGKEAIYSDENVQMIVTVISDNSDEKQDNFVLKPYRILKDVLKKHASGDPFEVTQPAGEHCWKLHALI